MCLSVQVCVGIHKYVDMCVQISHKDSRLSMGRSNLSGNEKHLRKGPHSKQNCISHPLREKGQKQWQVPFKVSGPRGWRLSSPEPALATNSWPLREDHQRGISGPPPTSPGLALPERDPSLLPALTPTKQGETPHQPGVPPAEPFHPASVVASRTGSQSSGP